jgi:hypothetical protein
VLQRLPRHPAVEKRLEFVELVRPQFRTGNRLSLHLTPAEVKYVPDQQVGIHLGGGDTGRCQPHNRPVAEFCE